MQGETAAASHRSEIAIGCLAMMGRRRMREQFRTADERITITRLSAIQGETVGGLYEDYEGERQART